jgi:hypothetical protein
MHHSRSGVDNTEEFCGNALVRIYPPMGNAYVTDVGKATGFVDDCLGLKLLAQSVTRPTHVRHGQRIQEKPISHTRQ